MTLIECVTHVNYSSHIWVYRHLQVLFFIDWSAGFLSIWILSPCVIPSTFSRNSKFVDRFEQACRNPHGNKTTWFSVSDVLVQVTVRAASMTVFCRVGDPFPFFVGFLIAHAVRAAQVSTLGLAIVYRLPCWSLSPLIASLLVVIVPQIFQV